MTAGTLIKPLVYQAPVVTAVKSALETKDEALFVMATGLGKTIVSALIVQEWLESGKKGLFLCHNTDILAQAEEEYRKVIRKEIVYKTFYGNKEKDWTADTGNLVFASFQGLNSWYEKWYQAFDPDHFDFMVVDEVHHSQASSYREVIEYFTCKKIGMTATPDRMDLKDIREIFGTEVYTVTLEEGIAHGWLANVEYHILSDGINNRKLKKICRAILEKGKRVSVKQLNETIFIRERNLAQKRIIHEYTQIKKYAGSKKTMMFCENTTHANDMAALFDDAAAIHSKMPGNHNKDSLRDLRDGKIRRVTSVNKLNEGVDVKDIEVVVFLRATDSLTVFFQQLGRALRLAPGKTKVIILDFVSNVERLIMVRDLMNRVQEIQAEIDGKDLSLLERKPFHVTGRGFEFIFSDELVDIMKVLEGMREGYYKTWQEASMAAIGLGISNSTQYLVQKLFRGDIRLPSNPQAYYGEFPGWLRFFEKKVAPDGWCTASQISDMRELHTSQKKVEEKAENYRKTNPEWFKKYCTAKGNVEHYHPQLVDLIRSLFTENKVAPLGWLNFSQVAKSMNSDRETISRLLKPLRYSHPHGFMILKSNGLRKRTLEHISPELILEVQKVINNRESAPSGWMTASMLHCDEQIVALDNTIKTWVEQFREQNPLWFRLFWQQNSFYEYYHPELIEKVRNTFGTHVRKSAPSGWITSNKLARNSDLIVKADTIKKFAEQYRVSNPQWFEQFWTESFFSEHYHPDLVSVIRNHFATRSLAPTGWCTARFLESQRVGAKIDRIKNFANNFRLTNPEWFKVYMTTKGNKEVEHYHPDLVDLIKEHFKENKR